MHRALLPALVLALFACNEKRDDPTVNTPRDIEQPQTEPQPLASTGIRVIQKEYAELTAAVTEPYSTPFAADSARASLLTVLR